MNISDDALKMIFCNDAKLKFEVMKDKKRYLVPVDFFLKTIHRKTDNAIQLLEILKHSVYIQKGTTLGDILLALEPWQDAISSYTGRDVNSYIAEVKKLFSVEPDEQEKYKDAWLDFQSVTIISQQKEKFYKDNGEAVMGFFGRDYTREVVSKKLNTFSKVQDEVYQFHMYIGEDPQHYSIPDLRISRNIPVFINPNSYIITHDDEVFTTENPAIHSVEKCRFIICKKYTPTINFEDFIYSIFANGFFFHSPKDAEIAYESTSKILEEDAHSQEDELEDDDISTDELRIEVREGVMDNVYTHLMEEFALVEHYIEECKKEDHTQVELGINPLEESEKEIVNMLYINIDKK